MARTTPTRVWRSNQTSINAKQNVRLITKAYNMQASDTSLFDPIISVVRSLSVLTFTKIITDDCLCCSV